MNKKQTLAVASGSVLAAGMAQGAIVYTGPINAQLGNNDTYTIYNMYGDGQVDYTVWFDNSNANKPFIDCRDSAGAGNAWVLAKANTGVPLTQFGTNFDSAYAATYPTNKLGYLYQNYDANVVGDWPNSVNSEGYVGLALVNGSSTNFGWIHLMYNAAGNTKTVTLVDYAYESDVNKGIIAGAVVTPGAPLIYKNPLSQTNGCGSSVQMSVVALADPAPTYQWQAGPIGSGAFTNLADNGNVTGSATATLKIAAVNSACALDYRVIISNSLGDATSSPPATLTVPNAVLAGPIPSVEQVFPGQTGHFQINLLSGNSPVFHWRKNGMNLADGGNISGSATSNLRIGSISSSDNANYDVVVSTACGDVTSDAGSLTMVPTNGGLFEASVLANGPVGYYRLNELSDPSTNTPAFDNVGANNGVYGSTVRNGYNSVAGPRAADGFSGFRDTNAAIQISPNDFNSTIALMPWNLNTNTVTITAWINPQAKQVQGAGIVYTRSTNNMVCGLAYHGSTNANGEYSLGYNWNDNMSAWNWTSGLLVPQSQWSFVALVVTPTNGTVYVMNSSNGTNNIRSAVDAWSHPVQSFNDTLYIGADPNHGNGSGNFNGYIDEVAVFNKSLSQDQLLQLFAASQGKAAITPQITSQPLPQAIIAGGSARFGVTAIGNAPLVFQWKAGTGGVYTNLVDNASVSGATTPAVVLQNVSAGNVANYLVVVTNAGGSVTSSVAPLSLVTPGHGIYESVMRWAGGAVAYYELNETNNPASGGAIAFDNLNGFNGIYGTAVQNANPLYAVAGPRPSDGFPGLSLTNAAARFTNSGFQSMISLPALNLNTNAVTITAWINPATNQAQWASVVFCRGASPMVAGLDYTQTNLLGQSCLGYHWNDGYDTYEWSSGLIPPTNQWSFVALVLDPATTNATVYLINTNGTSSASHYSTNNAFAMSFNAPTLIGNDPLDLSAKGFVGAIDEVGIFNRAFGSDEVQALYSAGLARVNVKMRQVGSNLQVSWPAGTLLEATKVTGPWVTNTSPSPYQPNPAAAAQKFYRVITQ